MTINRQESIWLVVAQVFTLAWLLVMAGLGVRVVVLAIAEVFV